MLIKLILLIYIYINLFFLFYIEFYIFKKNKKSNNLLLDYIYIFWLVRKRFFILFSIVDQIF